MGYHSLKQRINALYDDITLCISCVHISRVSFRDRMRHQLTRRFSMMRFSGRPTRASIHSSSASSSVMR